MKPSPQIPSSAHSWTNTIHEFHEFTRIGIVEAFLKATILYLMNLTNNFNYLFHLLL